MNERNVGVDLLRCVAMFMVLTLHLLLYSETLTAHPLFSAGYETAWALESLAFCAVNVYALISGYVGAGRTVRYAGLAHLWLTVFFYSMALTGVFALLRPDAYDLFPDGFFPPFVRAAFPVASNQYWYFCSYFVLFLFLPLVNAGLEKLTDRQLKLTALLLFLVFCVLGVIAYVDVLRVYSGYSPMWLLTLYVMGAALKRADPLKKLPNRALVLGFFLCGGITLLSKYGLEKLTVATRGAVNRSDYLLRYISPTVLGAAVCLLLLFSRLRLPGWLKKLTAFLTPSAFSVYLIQEHPLMREFFMKKYFFFLKQLSPLRLVIGILLCAAALYLAFTAADLLRRGLFRLLKVKERLARAEETIGGKLRGAPQKEETE